MGANGRNCWVLWRIGFSKGLSTGLLRYIDGTETILLPFQAGGFPMTRLTLPIIILHLCCFTLACGDVYPVVVAEEKPSGEYVDEEKSVSETSDAGGGGQTAPQDRTVAPAATDSGVQEGVIRWGYEPESCDAVF